MQDEMLAAGGVFADCGIKTAGVVLLFRYEWGNELDDAPSATEPGYQHTSKKCEKNEFHNTVH
ncbi:MAG: hypothetical protein JXA42_11575 [Anaerolineales bacterium]|nr:hypothetical protein [Anaerolineales bacterium]